MRTIAILIFDGAEEMDFVGPWEVLTAASEVDKAWRVVTVAPSLDLVQCEKAMRVLPDYSFSDLEKADVVIVPGGSGARREIKNPNTVQWLKTQASACMWMTSVCTGAFLLVGSGIAKGRKVTTHHRFYQQLRELGGTDVIEDVRFVRDGNIVSAGGVMSGIEMSLWLVGEIWGSDMVKKVKDYIAYDYPSRSSIENAD